MEGKVECLLCGRFVARIGNHIIKHSMKVEDYKALFPGAETCAYTHSTATRNKMSGERLSFKGVAKTAEHRANLSKARSGMKIGPHKPETITKMKEAWERRKADKEAYAAYVASIKERMNSPEMTAAMRERSLALIASGNHNGKSKDTKIELQMKDFLTNHSVGYEHQRILATKKGNFLFDFFIPSMNIFVEVDGEYWHRKSAMQINRDKLKERLCRDMGYGFLRISDKDWTPADIFLSPADRDLRSSQIMAAREEYLQKNP